MRPLVYSDTITVRTDAGLRAAINAAAEREGATASDWVRKSLAAIVPSAASTSSHSSPVAEAPRSAARC